MLAELRGGAGRRGAQRPQGRGQVFVEQRTQGRTVSVVLDLDLVASQRQPGGLADLDLRDQASLREQATRPLAGGDKPELTAWIRLTGDDTPIDVPRLITLADALAPSYTAILNELKMLPTIELTVRPGEALTRTSSPWALLHARTTSATADGWVNEEIDLWSPDGGHLGNASQLRVLR